MMDIPITDIFKKISSKDKRLEIYYDIASERVIIRHDNAAWNYPTFEEAIAGLIGSYIK
jgi:hypothetical protein